MNSRAWSDGFREFLRVSNFAEASVYQYGLEARRFCSFLEERGVTEPHQICRDDIFSYQLLLRDLRKPDGKPLAAGTRSNKLKAVSAFLRYLKEAGFVVSALARHVKSPKVPDSLPPELPDEEQIFRLLEQPDVNSPVGKRDRAILELVYACALRNAELRALNLDDLDLHRLEVDIKKSKGGKSRRLPLTEVSAVWLESYLIEGRPLLETKASGDALFLNTVGRRLRGLTLGNLVRGHAEAAGLPMKMTPHILRHACATHMLERKAGLRHLQHFLGHAHSSSTERYTRVEISDLREVLLRCHPRENF